MSDEQAGAAAAATDGALLSALGLDDDAMKKLMETFEKNGSMGSEEEMEGLLRSLLGEMTDKEVLYEPMKELASKYPAWLEANGAKLSADELRRYEAQSRRVAEIAAKFEEETYSDQDAACRAYIMERMEQVGRLSG